MANQWQINGKSIVIAQKLITQSMANQWQINSDWTFCIPDHGIKKSLLIEWFLATLHPKSMANQWQINGKSMANQWQITHGSATLNHRVAPSSNFKSLVICHWSAIDFLQSLLICRWFYGLSLNHVQINGKSIVILAKLHHLINGKSMANQWQITSDSQPNQWQINGKSLNQWQINGKSLVIYRHTRNSWIP